jgi:hypothetical protein
MLASPAETLAQKSGTLPTSKTPVFPKTAPAISARD